MVFLSKQRKSLTWEFDLTYYIQFRICYSNKLCMYKYSIVFLVVVFFVFVFSLQMFLQLAFLCDVWHFFYLKQHTVFGCFTKHLTKCCKICCVQSSIKFHGRFIALIDIAAVFPFLPILCLVYPRNNSTVTPRSLPPL